MLRGGADRGRPPNGEIPARGESPGESGGGADGGLYI